MDARGDKRRGRYLSAVSFSAGGAISLAVHLVLGLALALLPQRSGKTWDVVDLTVERRRPVPEPEPETLPEPAALPEPEPEPDQPRPRPKVRQREPEPPPATPPEPPPPEPEPPPDAKEAPPVFDLGDNTFAVGAGAGWSLNPSEGNTKFAKVAGPGQKQRGTKVAPGPEGKPGGTGFQPVPARDLSSLPAPSGKGIRIPPYPEDAKREGIEGVVLLQVFIGKDGRVTRVRILEDPGGGLGEVARQAMLQESWTPAKDKQGNPVDTVIPYKYRFVLDG
jgi:protein TonB